MATVINSPNMNLPVPVVGQESGPQYASDVNGCFSILDQHNHSAGSGVQINPSGININAALAFNGNFAISSAGMVFSPLLSTPASTNTIYDKAGNLFFVDNLGNDIQLTISGGVAGTPGSIANLVPPASASYVSANDTFVWQSGTGIAANMDLASLLLRNITPNSTFALTLQPPSSLAANYSLTLPSLPPQQSFMTLDASGNMAAPWTVDGSTIQIVGNQLVATTQLAPATESQVNAGTDNTAFVTSQTLAGKTRNAVFNIAGTYTWTAPVGVNTVLVSGRGGSGGGGSATANTGGTNACGGAGGAGVVSITRYVGVTPGTQYTVVVGAGGAGGAAVSNGNGNAGSSGAISSFATTVQFKNVGTGGAGGVSGGSAAGGTPLFLSYGGTGGAAQSNVGGSNGGDSVHQIGGAGGGILSAGAACGGGGGGAGDSGGATGANAASPNAPGGAGSGGGGGGGSCGVGVNTSGAGGKGSDGQIVIVYSDVVIVNTST